MRDWMLSEESWTKSRNWARRTLMLAVIAGAVASSVAGVAGWLVMRVMWSDLERYYAGSYLWSAAPSVLSSTGAYNLVVVSVPGRPNYLAMPEDVSGGAGSLALTRAGRSRGVLRVGLRQYQKLPHAVAYWTLRDHIYAGKSAWRLFWLPRWIWFVMFTVLMWGGMLRDHQDREAKAAGVVDQGPKLVTAEEFNTLYKGDGLGLTVKSGIAGRPIQIRIPKTYEPQSLVILGDTGAGKTVAFKQLIDQIEQRGDLAVIHDPKSDYLPLYFNSKRGDHILNPFDVRSPFWNPSDEITSPADVETVANAFFPDTPGKDVFWTESPRKLMTVFLQKKMSAAGMVRLFEDEGLIDKAIAGSRFAALIDPKSPPQRNGVLSELTKLAQVLQWLPDEQDANGRWSAAAWTAEPRGWLFLSSRMDQFSALQTLYSIWLELLITKCLAKRFTKRVWFIVDELPVLRHIPTLQKLITLGRECNVPVMVGLQGRAQLDERYGPSGAEVILSQPVTKILLRTSEPKAAKWISDSIGVQSIERVREGVTAGVQDVRDSVNYTPERRIEPVILDSVIAGLPNLRGYFKFLENVVEIEYEPKDRPVRTEPLMARPLKPAPPPAPAPPAAEPVAAGAPSEQAKKPAPQVRLLG